MLRWRVATALTLAPIVLGAIVLGYWTSLGYWTVLSLLLLVIARAAYELARVLKPLPFLAALGAGLFPVAFSIHFGTHGILAGALLSLPWALFWLARKPEVRTLRAVLAILLMALWVGAPLAHIELLSKLDSGTTLILMAVVGPWVSDTGAYFAGRLFGQHLIFPSLSPKKTVEGSLGGLFLTTLVVGWVGYEFLELSMLRAAVMGAAVSVFSQSGDLFESVLKRIMDIKDLGRALPGHGGILDRVDSLLFTAPAVYYLLILYEAF